VGRLGLTRRKRILGLPIGARRPYWPRIGTVGAVATVTATTGAVVVKTNWRAMKLALKTAKVGIGAARTARRLAR
jgi:hypothetical protein